MKNFYIKIFNYFSHFYLFIFGRRFFYKFNLILLKLILKSIGYQNYGNYNFTGEKSFVKSIKKFNPKVCVDIGAHTGSYTKLIINELDCKVISFEPNKYSFLKLKKLKSIFSNKIYPFNYAITNQNKNLYLYYGDRLSQLASLSKNLSKINFIKNSNKNKILVKGITLDNFFNKHKNKFSRIDFIKIDVQGYNLEVLKGSNKALEKAVGIEIECEFKEIYKNQSLFRDVDEYLSKHNFELCDFTDIVRWSEKVNDEKKQIDKIDNQGEIIFVNALYIKKNLQHEKIDTKKLKK